MSLHRLLYNGTYFLSRISPRLHLCDHQQIAGYRMLLFSRILVGFLKEERVLVEKQPVCEDVCSKTVKRLSTNCSQLSAQHKMELGDVLVKMADAFKLKYRKQVHVSGRNFVYTKDVLHKLFSQFGEVVYTKCNYQRAGFAIITFRHDFSADNAIKTKKIPSPNSDDDTIYIQSYFQLNPSELNRVVKVCGLKEDVHLSQIINYFRKFSAVQFATLFLRNSGNTHAHVLLKDKLNEGMFSRRHDIGDTSTTIEKATSMPGSRGRCRTLYIENVQMTNQRCLKELEEIIFKYFNDFGEVRDVRLKEGTTNTGYILCNGNIEFFETIWAKLAAERQYHVVEGGMKIKVRLLGFNSED